MIFDEVKLKDIATILNGRAYKQNELLEDGKYKVLRVGNFFTSDRWYFSDLELDENKYCNFGDLLYAWSANFGPKIWNEGKTIFHYHIWKIELKENIDKNYIFYYLKFITDRLKNSTHGSVMMHLTKVDMENQIIRLPSYNNQKKIGKILSNIDLKMELNNQINDNLSEQLKQIFNNKFFDKIQNNDCNEFKEYSLYDVLDVIDNRGKTPKLVEFSKYPIIDVRAISGENRIIDYKQCQKYVDEEVYNTFFRSGHPKINDILISTVGSLAEMKIYKENKGTIAQNVVALRCKENYPMYIYQYLKAIKNDLISYNIGSVQPSIKVTQFMKHSIFIPKEDELNEFENTAQIYTDKMFNISKQNETLEQLRDTLLPRLMNGEIDLDKIEI